VTLNRLERAYWFTSRAEAERVAAERNGTLIHGGEAESAPIWPVT
jgi:hypothetical protein